MNLSSRILTDKELDSLLKEIKASYKQIKFRFVPKFIIYEENKSWDDFLSYLTKNIELSNFCICFIEEKYTNIAKLLVSIRYIDYVCITTSLDIKNKYERNYCRL